MSWPFENWLRVAVIQLGLNPSEFWSLSLQGWRALTQSNAVDPLPRDVFENLSAAYPDERQQMERREKGKTYET